MVDCWRLVRTVSRMWRNRGLGRRRGITLIEVVVIVLILGFLVGLFVYATQSWAVRDRAAAHAEATLANVLAAQKDLAATYGVYSTLAGDLGFAGRHAQVSTAPSTGPEHVSVRVGVNGTLGLAALAEDGTCVLWQVAPLYDGGAQETVAPPGSSEPCTAALALPAGESAATQVSPVRTS